VTIEGEGLTFARTTEGRTLDVGRYCGERCRDAARAVIAIRDIPIGSSSGLQRQREEIADALLDLWRRGVGPDPAEVLFAAEYARA
jgi:hypothetical protein